MENAIGFLTNAMRKPQSWALHMTKVFNAAAPFKGFKKSQKISSGFKLENAADGFEFLSFEDHHFQGGGGV
jgi:hypothetical protein